MRIYWRCLLTRKQYFLNQVEEEQKAWSMPYAVFIPLPELPKCTRELDKSMSIIKAYPHKNRAIMAMMYLKGKGYKVKYLEDGLL